MKSINKKIRSIITLAIIFLSIITMKTYATDNNITGTFLDENLKNEILELAKEATGEENKTEIYMSDIDKIIEQPGGTSLRLAGKGIKDLSGIEAFSEKEITWIFLDWNEITDLTPLQDFKNLTKISFSGNQVIDLTPLSKIKTLENITAINNKIETIKPLQNLKDIKYITLDGNKLAEINSISAWSKLIDISFQNNQIETIPNLTNLNNLETINLSNNKIATLENLSSLENMKKLEIDNNQIKALKGIENFKNLEVLSCSNNQITDISEISSLNKLENLNVNKNQIQSIENLTNNNFKYLYMDNNYIFNFETLKNQTNLQKYTIYNQNAIIEIKDELIENKILVPLPDLYANLYDSNSFIYNKDAKTEIIGTSSYKIDEDKKYIELNKEDLKQGQISVKVSDQENIILNYTIIADTIAPSIKGVTDNGIYKDPVIPICEDNDVKEVVLTKNNKEITYDLGDKIEQAGQYILIARDKAGNEARIRFTIEENINVEEYQLEGQYIIGVKSDTYLEIFKEKLNGNVNYQIYRENMVLDNNQKVATGDKIVTEEGTNFYIIVEGDITKDGTTDIKDLVRLRRKLINMDKFDEPQNMAADIYKDKSLTIKDLEQIRKIIISK